MKNNELIMNFFSYLIFLKLIKQSIIFFYTKKKFMKFKL